MTVYRANRYEAPRYDRPVMSVLWNRLRHSMPGCLIVANVVVFLIIKMVYLCGATLPSEWLLLKGSIGEGLRYPWGLLTYMFVHVEVLHLLFNMMWLWAFGVILVRFCGSRALLRVYVLSGIGGGVLFIAISSIEGTTCFINGASAAVLGVIAAVAVRSGRERVQMMLFGSVEVRWVAVVAIVLCVVSGGAGNVPVLAAHLGGAGTGALYALVKLRGRATRKAVFNSTKTNPDTSGWRPQAVRQHERRGLSIDEQAEFDVLLSRVRKVGYKNLSMAEQRRLFELSSHIK